MSRRAGFANPEYLISFAVIIALVSLIVPPVYRARQRARNLSALAELRAASARYAADAKSKGPLELADLVKDGRYLSAIPEIEIFGFHSRSARVTPMGLTDDTGGWTHANWPGGAREGEIWINCTHTDARGALWSSY